jgi:MFS family permease
MKEGGMYWYSTLRTKMTAQRPKQQGIKQAEQQEQQQSEADLKVVQRTTLVIAMFAGFIFPFTASSMNIAVPLIGKEFEVIATSLSWIVSALMLTSIALSVPFGRFADLWGKRRIFNIGIFIFFVATLVITFTPSFPFLIGFRVAQGVGAAMLSSTNNALLMDVFPVSERGRVLGLSVMATYIGLTCGPVFSGFIVHYLGWRAVFTITALFALVVFIIAMISSSKLSKNRLSALGIQDTDVAGGKVGGVGIDPASIVLYMLAILSTMYGLTIFSQNIYSYLFLGAGIVLFAIFAKHATMVERPVIEVRLFRNNLRYIASNVVALLQYSATFALGYIMSIYLQVVKGFPADIAGLILIAQPLMMAIVSPIVGRLSDKWSPFKISSIGMAICAVAMLSLLTIDENASLLHIILNLLAVGIGFGIFSSPNTNAILSCVSPRDYSVANSILGTMRSSGQLISMAIITIVTHLTIGDMLIEAAGTAGIMTTFRVSFLVFAIICALGVVLSLTRTKSSGKSQAVG